MNHEEIIEVSKNNIDYIVEVEKFNPYHGSDGRFTSAGSATSFTYSPGKSKAHDMAIAREKERAKAEDEKKNPYGFKMISGPHSSLDDVKGTNPKYSYDNREYNENCQRCVPTYEMRRRGYDVTAKPRIFDREDVAANQWHRAFVGQRFVQCYEGTGRRELEKRMAEWGDGARAEVYVRWKGHGQASSHVFVAEQANGKTHYYDPQTGNTNAAWYFKEVRPHSTSVARIDNLTPDPALIKEYCE